MTKYLFIIIGLSCLVQCAHPPELSESEKYFREAKAEEEARKNEHESKMLSIRDSGKPLLIEWVAVLHNSAGGQEPSIRFINTADADIKYITFNVTFFNTVGDKAVCKIRGVSSDRLKLVGPFVFGKREMANWNPVIYSDSRCYMEISSIQIDYMNGSSKTLNRQEVDGLSEEPGWNSWLAKSQKEREQEARFP